jgi:hypothetical protein
VSPRRPPRGLARALLLAAALGLGAPAQAAAPAPLQGSVTSRGGRLQVSLDLSSVFVPAMERQLGNGLTNLVAFFVTVLPEAGGEPVAFHARVVEILFDVWDETYAVTVKDPRTPAGRRLVLSDFQALRTFLSDERDVDLGPLAALPPGLLVVEARVEVNPVSKEQLQRTREYIANPSGARPGGSGSRSVLGAVASFLLREPDPGSDVYRFRSLPFTRSEVASR